MHPMHVRYQAALRPDSLNHTRKTVILQFISKLIIDDLTAKRPEKGIPSINYTDYIGKIAKKSLKKGTFLKAKDLKAR